MSFSAARSSEQAMAKAAEDQVILDAWYEEKDGAEAVVLERRVVVMPSLQMLQVQLDLALDHLASSIAQLQQIGVENKRLRQEIVGLKRQLVGL